MFNDLLVRERSLFMAGGGRCKYENRVQSKFAPPLSDPAHSKFAPLTCGLNIEAEG